MLISLVGILILSIILLDVFFTVLDANGLSLLSSRAYRWFWWLWRHGVRLLPTDNHHAALNIGAPLMIGLVLSLWIGGLVVGFAFIYFGGLHGGAIVTGGGSQPSLEAAFRLSWVTLSTIGFVEISPSDMRYSLAVALEAIFGAIMMTFTITYFLSVHRVVLDYNHLVTRLNHTMVNPEDPIRSLAPFAGKEGQASRFDEWIKSLHEGVVIVHEGLRRFPIAYYFRPRRRKKGLPFTVETIGTISLALRHGLSADHRLCQAPGVRALDQAVGELVDDLRDRYVPITGRTVIAPVSKREFSAIVDRRRTLSADPWAEIFLRDRKRLLEILGDTDSEPAPSYSAYRAWLRDALPLHDFVSAIKKDLGYGDGLRPGRSSSLRHILSQGPKDRPQPLARKEEAS